MTKRIPSLVLLDTREAEEERAANVELAAVLAAADDVAEWGAASRELIREANRGYEVFTRAREHGLAIDDDALAGFEAAIRRWRKLPPPEGVSW